MAWSSYLHREYNLPSRVYVFDTTLRDGEQTPSVSLRVEEKVAIAEALSDLGVDVIEAGFPVVSRGELTAVKKICSLGLPSKICVLSRCDKNDIDAAVDSGADWVHVFIATSDVHMKHKLGMTREQVLSRAIEMTGYAKSRGVTVHFSAEDATRSDPSFLMDVYRRVKEAGADSIDIPDTVGFAVPYVMRTLARRAREVTDLPVAVHCHDDMGLATANTLAGVEGGAEIVHVTVNGIGERAGNTSLEEVVASLRFLYGVETGIDLSKMSRVSRLVSRLTGISVPKNKAIVGENAFSHESGIHVHGVLNNPMTYEPILPEVVGRRRRIVLGKHSGAHGVESVLKEYGYSLPREGVMKVLMKIKEMGDNGIKVSEQVLLQVISEALGGEVRQVVEVKRYSCQSNNEENECVVELSLRGESVIGIAKDKTPTLASLGASLKAIERLVGKSEVLDYTIYVPPYDGRNPAEAEVVLRIGGEEFLGRGLSSNPGLSVALAVAAAAAQYLGVTQGVRLGGAHREG